MISLWHNYNKSKMRKLFIPILLGTARKERESIKPARFVFEEIKKQPEADSALLDVRDFLNKETVSPWEDNGGIAEWKDKMRRADGLIVIVPEYNHGYPGELKILLDSLFEEYQDKVVSLCGVSSGSSGGARVVEHIKPVFVEFRMMITKESLLFPNVKDLFDEERKIKDHSYIEKAEKLFQSHFRLARSLREMRNK